MGDTNVVRKADATLPEGALGIALPADVVRVGRALDRSGPTKRRRPTPKSRDSENVVLRALSFAVGGEIRLCLKT